VVLAAALALPWVVSGCGGAGSAGDAKELALWIPPNFEDGSDLKFWDDQLKAFEEDNGVDVKVTIIPWDTYEERMLAGFSGSQAPDLTYMYEEMMGDYVSRGQLANFAPYLSDQDKANYSYLPLAQIDGQQIGLPMIVGAARVMFYNRTILDQIGAEPPATWDDFIEVGLKAKEAGHEAFAQAWGDPAKTGALDGFWPFLWQADGEVLAPDGTAAAFNSPEGVAALQYLHDLRFEHGLLPEASTALTVAELNQQFMDGKLLFRLAAESAAASWDEAGIDWGFVPSLKGKQEGTYVVCDSLVLPESAPDKEASTKLANYLLSADVMEAFHAKSPYPPVSADEPYSGNPEFRELYEQDSAILHNLPVAANTAPMYDALFDNIQAMFLGQKDPAQALADAADAADAALAKNK
jgi:multiple sugar transport system substrate-binding protein